MRFITLFLACLLSSYAHAGWTDRQGNPLPDDEDRKANGNFGAQIIFINDEQGLFKKWATPSEGVNINTVESVEINQPISAFVIFTGCKANTSGNCNVSMRFRVIQPDGKVYSETPAMEVWHDKPAPPGRSLELSAQYLKIIVEPHEQRGRYTVQTQVRDDNTDIVLPLQKSFTAVEPQSSKRHKVALADSLEDFGNQMSYFYLAPTQEAFNTFQKNAEQFRDKLEHTGNGAGILVAVMIAKISQTNNWYISDGALGVKANDILEGKSRLAKYISDDSLVDTTKLDVWWASFFATGDERFLENIFQHAGWDLPKDDIEMMQVIGAATWSFKSNCQQHKKVLEFAKRKLRSSSITETQAKFLKECITSAEKNTEQIAPTSSETLRTPRG